jgi:hypothetical protein
MNGEFIQAGGKVQSRDGSTEDRPTSMMSDVNDRRRRGEMEMPRRSRAGVTAAVVALSTVLAAGCSSGQSGAVQTSSTGAGVPAGGAAPTSATGSLSPLTGRAAPAGRPALAVKIDNVSPARPQTGIGKADVIYVEPVEGGLSRIMAIFSSQLPVRVGPVRSARQSDLELLGEYGTPGLAYSGANATVLSLIRSSSVINLSPDQVPGAYSRSYARPAPHNLYTDPVTLIAHARGISAAKDIGFRFGPLPSGTGTPATTRTVRYGAARTTFTWSRSARRWLVSLDGRPDVTTDTGRLGAATVVVEYVKITSSGLHDVLGNTTPYTHSIGSGKAVILRDGVAITGRWSRPSAAAGTTFTTTTGATVPFAAGQIWVVFAPSSASAAR